MFTFKYVTGIDSYNLLSFYIISTHSVLVTTFKKIHGSYTYNDNIMCNVQQGPLQTYLKHYANTWSCNDILGISVSAFHYLWTYDILLKLPQDSLYNVVLNKKPSNYRTYIIMETTYMFRFFFRLSL